MTTAAIQKRLAAMEAVLPPSTSLPGDIANELLAYLNRELGSTLGATCYMRLEPALAVAGTHPRQLQGLTIEELELVERFLDGPDSAC